MRRLTYPTPPTSDQVDDYHGTPIADDERADVLAFLELAPHPGSRGEAA